MSADQTQTKRVAIHHRENSFSIKWIEYCNIHNIYYEIVDAFDSGIIEKLKEFDVFLFHWHHSDLKSSIAMRNIVNSLEYTHVKCFPDRETSWHFDDKVAQKYLLASVEAPLINSDVFYSKKDALDYIKVARFPIVFKLKGGAGASNVKLVRTYSHANKLIKRAFSQGFPVVDRKQIFLDAAIKFIKKCNKENFVILAKAFGRLFIKSRAERVSLDGFGYIYFQEFIPDNYFDIRIIVIGDRAFGIKRHVRDGDFRASGSGNIEYLKTAIDPRCIEIAFETSKKLKTQCLAYDFVYKNGVPLIVEISYGFSKAVYLKCPGYWDSRLNWYEGQFTPEFFMMQSMLKG